MLVADHSQDARPRCVFNRSRSWCRPWMQVQQPIFNQAGEFGIAFVRGGECFHLGPRSCQLSLSRRNCHMRSWPIGSFKSGCGPALTLFADEGHHAELGGLPEAAGASNDRSAEPGRRTEAGTPSRKVPAFSRVTQESSCQSMRWCYVSRFGRKTSSPHAI